MRKLDHGPAAPKIARPSIHPNPSSRFRRTSIAPPTDDSQITQHRIPTLKSDRLLVGFSVLVLKLMAALSLAHEVEVDMYFTTACRDRGRLRRLRDGRGQDLRCHLLPYAPGSNRGCRPVARICWRFPAPPHGRFPRQLVGVDLDVPAAGKPRVTGGCWSAWPRMRDTHAMRVGRKRLLATEFVTAPRVQRAAGGGESCRT